MSDSNYPSPFRYRSYPLSTEFLENEPIESEIIENEFIDNEIVENEPIYGWMPPFSDPPFFDQGFSDNTPNLAEATPSASHPISHDHPRGSRVAIPRSTNSRILTNRGRVSRACESCRDQKVKCSGHRPTCQRCQESGIQCSYGDRKREKMARRLDDLTTRVQSVEMALRAIYPSLDSQSAHYVEQVLPEYNTDSGQVSNPLGSSSASPRSSPDPASLVSIDFTREEFHHEDFNRDEELQAVGFVGEHSEIAWMYRLKRAVDCYKQGPKANRTPVTAVNFFLDNCEIVAIEDVNLLQRPPPASANRLVTNYFQAVHPSFPVISKSAFLNQYRSFYSSPVQPGKRWLAILNLIFALSAKHFIDLSLDSEITMDDPLFYFSRAWKLSMRDDTLLEHPTLQQVQVEGLTSFYLMSIGHANRSWKLCGMSLNSAVTLGLNLRNGSNKISYSSRETRYRVWWSLCLLHASLSVMTGRLATSSQDSYTTPLPVPFLEEDFSKEEVKNLITNHNAREIFMETLSSKGCENYARNVAESFTSGTESPRGGAESSRLQTLSPGKFHGQVASVAFESLQPNTSLYFLYLVTLGVVCQRSVDALYAPGAARKSWRHIEGTIAELTDKAETWLSKLPTEFHFTEVSETFVREKLSLGFYFYSTRILITQPCLDRLLRNPAGAEQLQTFCVTTAATCVELAGQMLELLPDIPDFSWVYHLSPWWCIVHYIMQATTVLLTSVLLKEKAGAIQHSKALEWISKAVNWLAEIAIKDPSAQRAWHACNDLISLYEIELE